jgi:hypothetical protein
MSYATHTDFAGAEYHSKYQAEGFRPFEGERRKPGLLLTSLIAAIALSLTSGAIVLNRLDHLPTVDPNDAVGPITEYTTLQWREDAALRSGVVRERLSVLTPPVYKNQPVFSIATPTQGTPLPTAEKVEAEITGADAEELTAYLDAHPSAQTAENAPQTAAIAEAVAADVAAAEAMAQADVQSGPEPRYILEDEVAPPAQILEDDDQTTPIYDDDTVSM